MNLTKLNKVLLYICIAGLALLAGRSWYGFYNDDAREILPALLFSILTILGWALKDEV